MFSDHVKAELILGVVFFEVWVLDMGAKGRGETRMQTEIFALRLQGLISIYSATKNKQKQQTAQRFISDPQ